MPTPTVMSRENVWVFFRVGDVPCALPAQIVESVEASLDVTPAAGAPKVVIGLAVIRGQTIPVVDLHRLFGQPEPRSAGSCLVVRFPSGERAALRATETEDIEGVEETAFQPLAIPGGQSRFSRRVIVRDDGRIWLALDPDRLAGTRVRKVPRAA
ncbi:MAG: chemotaxis protein CheW [Chloroflexota bacterium]|nr:chemotaxis protein CheW [Dehalococcoidia bacterium]MDW8047198.1 chemotaxis protein CheW [Chloroflexota bacterium]